MGRRAKEKQLFAQASRRRAVLQIDRVSRRETGEGPGKAGPSRTVNPINSITGIGLLGAYADDSDSEKEDEGDRGKGGGGGGGRHSQQDVSSVAAQPSGGSHSEMDAKLADFFKEIESIDPDTTSEYQNCANNVEDGEEAVSSTADFEAQSVNQGDGQGDQELPYPWEACLDAGSNCYYYWNTETDQVQWTAPVVYRDSGAREDPALDSTQGGSLGAYNVMQDPRFLDHGEVESSEAEVEQPAAEKFLGQEKQLGSCPDSCEEPCSPSGVDVVQSYNGVPVDQSVMTGSLVSYSTWDCQSSDEEMPKPGQEELDVAEDRPQQVVCSKRPADGEEESSAQEWLAHEEELGQEAKKIKLDQGVQEEEFGQRVRNIQLDQGVQEEEFEQEVKNIQLDQGVQEEEFGQEVKSIQLDQGVHKEEFGQEVKNKQLDQRVQEEEFRQGDKHVQLDVQEEEFGEEAKNIELERCVQEEEFGQAAKCCLLDQDVQEDELKNIQLDQGVQEVELGQGTKNIKLDQGVQDTKVEQQDNSDDEFAAQLLEDTYVKGIHDIIEEENMEVSEEEEVEAQRTEEREDSNKPLLQPEVFEHMRSSAAEEKDESTATRENQEESCNSVEEDKYRLQVIDLSAVINNKLEFLAIARTGLSNFQVLLIEMETRIRDWRNGALESLYLVQRLEEADQQLKQYEESAVPPGWTCHWNRSHKRYYYTNLSLGKSQWEFPSDEAHEKNHALNHVTSSAMTSVSAETWNTAVQVPFAATSYIPSTTSLPSQTPMIPVVMGAVPMVMHQVVTVDPYRNPPVPGTDSEAEAVFNLNSSTIEEPPPPPPGTDDVPPLPPGTAELPPLPPLPPADPHEDYPPPPPAEGLSVAPPPPRPPEPPCSVSCIGMPSVTSSSMASGPQLSFGRTLVDYSDLEVASLSPPAFSSLPQPSSIVGTVQVPVDSGTASPIPSVTTTVKVKAKKKKKLNKVGSKMLSSKAKKVSSLVQKWQTLKQQEEPDLESSEEEEDRSVVAQREIEEWKKGVLHSGEAADNPNFVAIKGDWRERIRSRLKGTGTAADHNT